jgi:flagellar protein FliO/FliZ
MGKYLLALLAMPGLAFAEAAATAAPVAAAASVAGAPGSGELGGQLAQMLFGLLLVIALIFALAWLLRRVQHIVPKGGQVIKVVATQALGPRDRLLLVQVGEEQVLLGFTPGNLTALHVLQKPVPLPEGEPATGEFAQRLLELLGKDHKDKS